MAIEKNKPEIPPSPEKLMETKLKELLINYGEKVNEGNNGVIYKLNIDKIDPETKGLIFGKDAEKIPDKLAGKLLKIYTESAEEDEAINQQRAYNLIDSGNSQLAHIPAVYTHRAVEVTDVELKDMMEKNNIFSSHLQMVLMDYVDGDDLATHIFKKIIEETPNHTAEHYRQAGLLGGNVNFNELHQAVAHIVGFYEPTAVQKQGLEQFAVQDRNSQEIINHMKEHDIVLDKEIFERVSNTLKILHKNGVYHNDLHLRNIMMTYDDGGVDDVLIIDFAEVSDKNEEERQDDFSILTAYRELSFSKDEREAGKKRKKINAFEKQRERYLESPKYKQAWEKIEAEIANLLDKGSEENFEKINKKMFLDEILTSNEDALPIILMHIAKEDKEGVMKFINYHKRKGNITRGKAWSDILKCIDLL